MCAAPSSHYGAPLAWEGITVLPGWRDGTGNDILLDHYRWSKADLVITLCDSYVLNPELVRQMRCAHWIPVDCDPPNFREVANLGQTGALPIAMSRFGQRALKGRGVSARYVPHAIDIKTFSPPADHMEQRNIIGLGKDTFVIGINAFNKDVMRKAFAEQFLAFSQFHQQHPDSMLLVHSCVADPSSVDLRALAEETGISASVLFPDQYAYATGMMTAENMASWYGALDLLSNCSYGEGFGLPIVEAQACFPAETPVSATGIERTMSRTYSGEMVSVTTARGDTVEATAEHPFWTDRGWIPAAQLRHDDLLLYTGGYASSGIQEVHAGTIGEVVAALRTDATEGSGRARRYDLRGGVLAGAAAGPTQTVLADRQAEPSYRWSRESELPGWPHRRRGNRIHSQIQRQVQTDYPRCEYVSASDGMAGETLRRSFDVYRASSYPTSQRTSVLHVPYSGTRAPATVSGAGSQAGYQTPANGVPSRVHRAAPDSESFGSLVGAATGTGLYRAEPEYQAIRSIARRVVRELPVYNLTTTSGTYTAAGYLVHNCGTPVAVTDCSSMSELAGPGWKIPCPLPSSKFWVPAHRGWWRRPDPALIADAYEQAFQVRENGKMMELRGQSREFALAYDADVVLTQRWKPVLDEIESNLPENG